MNEQKYNELKDAIVKANPEIMGLKFGCLVSLNGDIYYVMRPQDKLGAVLMSDGKLWTKEYMQQVKGLKILGRPIRLADVILSLEKQPGSIHWWASQKIQVVGKWNCSIDNLDHQSDETKQFLINLLCP